MAACLILLPAVVVMAEVQTVNSSLAGQPESGIQMAQRSSENPAALGQDVTRPFQGRGPVHYGHYEYVPQRHMYGDYALESVYENFQSVVSGIWEKSYVLDRLASFSTRGTLGNFTLSGSLGLNGLNLPSGGVLWGDTYNTQEDGYLRLAMGPLVLDQFYAGYGALYSDIYGNSPWGELLDPDDRWAHIVWLSFRATMFIGDSFAFSLQPMIYWLPETGEVGWGLPGPLVGIMAPQLASGALLRLAYARDIGNWQITLYDQFSPFIQPYTFWDVATNANLGFFGDLTPVDRVGRHQLGYGGAQTSGYDPTAHFRIGASDRLDGLLGYYNMVGARASGTHGYSLRSLIYLDRFDLWDRNFNRSMGQTIGGAYLRNQLGNITTYAGYNFAHLDTFDTWVHSAVAGFTTQISPYLIFYGEAGHSWITGGNVKIDGQYTGLVGFQNRLGPGTMQSLEAGRRVNAWMFNAAPRIEDYLEYRFTHQLGARGALSVLAGVSERRTVVLAEDDQEIQYAGAFLNFQVTQRLNSFANVGWERGEFKFLNVNNQDYSRWLYRLGLMHMLTQDTQVHCSYQYDDVTGNPFNYSEHLVYFGITRRF